MADNVAWATKTGSWNTINPSIPALGEGKWFFIARYNSLSSGTESYVNLNIKQDGVTLADSANSNPGNGWITAINFAIIDGSKSVELEAKATQHTAWIAIRIG